MYPLDLVKMQCWKLTLPIGSAGKPTEIKMPALATYSSEWCHVNAANDGVVFMAPTDGVTTSGSKNPRSEWRETSTDGKVLAAWSSTVGTHSMEVECSIDALPIGSKPVVVCGQIHDSKDDATVFRFEGNTTGDRSVGTLWITDGDNSHGFRVATLRLGERFRVGFRVADGVIRYTFNGLLLNYSQTKKVDGCYFKAGCYNQSGGIVTKLPDGRADYAQVTIYKLLVCHDGRCVGTTPGSEIVPVDPQSELAAKVTALQAQVDELRALQVKQDALWAALRQALVQ